MHFFYLYLNHHNRGEGGRTNPGTKNLSIDQPVPIKLKQGQRIYILKTCFNFTFTLSSLDEGQSVPFQHEILVPFGRRGRGGEKEVIKYHTLIRGVNWII